MTSLYIHIPFCLKKCFYCSFIVVIAKQQSTDSYLDCIQKESSCYKRAQLKTIYIGGGTPSILNNEQLKKLFDVIYSQFDISNNIEFTFEVNPEDININKAVCLHKLGVNRISLGVQTFDDNQLGLLGRVHDSAQSMNAFKCLREAGFNNINIDLMYSYPNQCKETIMQDIDKVTSLDCEHVSIYALSIEKYSRFYVQKIKQQEEQIQADQYNFICRSLEDVNLKQYEISNFSKQGKESFHNMNYWEGGNYIGLGVGAHSHIDGHRYWNVSKLKTYMSRIDNNISAVEDSEVLSPARRLKEAIVFGLRMSKGINLKELERKYNYSLAEDYLLKVNNFVSNGFLKYENDYLMTTLKGKLVLDEISSYLV